MDLDVVSLDKLIKTNKIMEVTSPNALGADGMPDPAGLYSFEIFGRMGSEERKINFGYINLKRKFLHPFAYNMIYQMFRNLPNVLLGEKFVLLKSNGEMVLSDKPEDGYETGIDFFINNWKKIKWNTNDSSAREKKENIFSLLDEDEIFIDKWLVIPCWYRDINLNQKGRISVDEINGLYVKLLNIVNSESITYTNSYYTQSALQNMLVEIHNFLSDKIKGKKGVIRQAIMGKSIDYSAISVISAPRIESERYQDQMIPFTYIGLPLYQVCATFFPFMLKWLEDYFYPLEHNTKIKIAGYPPKNISETILNEISTDNLEKLVNGYHKDKTKMIRSLPLVLTEELPNLMYIEKLVGRKPTLTDVLYAAALDVVADKHVICSRYPITGPESIIICRIKVLTTSKTIDLLKQYDSSQLDLSDVNARNSIKSKELDPRYVGYKTYPKFPLDKNGNVLHDEIEWIDTLVPNNSVLPGMGGDFDGERLEH